MKLSWWIFAALIAVACPLNANADDTTHSVAIGGAGSDKCASWTEDRGASSGPAKQASERRTEWISGFFSAVNFFAEPNGSLHGGIDDRDGMLGWIDNYCREHPSDPLFVAAADLVFDLRNHPRP
ncbi:MAG TPA: hypothetical protein VJ476_05625 [Rhizomicrobium sp.]|nr:hypothetical protein [Rhizomicrobium sp.]